MVGGPGDTIGVKTHKGMEIDMNRLTSATLSLALGGGLVMTLTPEAQATTSIREKALHIAAAQKGDPYRLGATGPNAYDCSGLTLYSYKQAGRTLPRTAQAQYNKLPHVSPGNRRVGDLVFIGSSSGSIYHVGIYTGWKDGKGWLLNANDGDYGGHQVVNAPLKEYTAGEKAKAYYARPK